MMYRSVWEKCTLCGRDKSTQDRRKPKLVCLSPDFVHGIQKGKWTLITKQERITLLRDQNYVSLD